jgi:hypothetical protein
MVACPHPASCILRGVRAGRRFGSCGDRDGDSNRGRGIGRESCGGTPPPQGYAVGGLRGFRSRSRARPAGESRVDGRSQAPVTGGVVRSKQKPRRCARRLHSLGDSAKILCALPFAGAADSPHGPAYHPGPLQKAGMLMRFRTVVLVTTSLIALAVFGGVVAAYTRAPTTHAAHRVAPTLTAQPTAPPTATSLPAPTVTATPSPIPPPTATAPPPTAIPQPPPPSMNGIPQQNGGDADGDNNGAPSDNDGDQ